MRSVLAFAGLVAVALAGNTITQTTTIDVTVTSCGPAPTDCNDPSWEDASVDPTSTGTWADASIATSTPAANTWGNGPSSSVPAGPVASWSKSAPVAQYTGGASTLTGAGLAGVAAVAAMLL